jgi:acyl-CoA synthetase (AMP-forming)/AMP-acid ligase II
MNASESSFLRYSTLWELIEDNARDAPRSIAIAAPNRPSLTYARLQEQVLAVATALDGMGIDRRDRVAITLPNGPEMAVAFLAISAMATSSPLNPGYTEHEFQFYLEDLNPVAIVVPSAGDCSAIVAQSLGIRIIELSLQSDAEAGVFSLSGDSIRSCKRDLCGEPDHLAMILHTSGTTSRPKRVGLTQSNILTSAYNISDTLSLTADDRCLNIMPLFHIHGLVASFLSSLTARASVFCSPGFYAPRFFDWVNEFQPTWYTAVPTMHQAILARAAAESRIADGSTFRFIRSASSPLPPRVMSNLERVFGVPVVEAYGMTEAAHQITSNPLPPAKRKPGTVGVVRRTEVAIIDEDGCFLAPGETGEIVLRGANVIEGYLNNPEANETSFLKGWFKSGDRGFLDEDGYLSITGRVKEIINRGGEKISPREIDDVLLEHPAIAQAVCFAVPDSTLGEDVGAALVLNEGASVTEDEVRDYVASRLASFKVPRRLVFLKEIPKGATGKVQRIGLAARLGLGDQGQPAPKLRVEYVPPRTPVESELAVIWQDVLRLDRVGVHDTFLSIGGDSVLATLIASRVRDAMQVDIPPVSLFGSPTVESMALAVTRHMGELLGHGELDSMLLHLDGLSEEDARGLLSVE